MNFSDLSPYSRVCHHMLTGIQQFWHLRVLINLRGESSNLGSCLASLRISYQCWLVCALNLQTQGGSNEAFVTPQGVCLGSTFGEVITELLELKRRQVSSLVLDITCPHLFSWNDVLIPLKVQKQIVGFSFILSQWLSFGSKEPIWNMGVGWTFYFFSFFNFYFVLKYS